MKRIFKTFLVFFISSFLWGLVVASTEGFFGLLGDDPNIVGFIVIFSVPIVISILYFRYRKGKKKQVKEQPKTLSEKYTVLETYKALAFLLMLVATGSYIYSLVEFKAAEGLVLISTISYVITIFSLYCLTKMIDFLYDLDKK